ncbi:MAG TPA: hypothetical protein VLF90_04090 [Patescibacteria group bacterium]|nr:hypothetical protein [Patescibacteria group bacterium]
MKTQTTTKDSLSELRDFVVTQAAEDAVLPRVERNYQANVVKEVLTHEPIKSSQIKELVHNYSSSVASHLKAA